MPGLEGDFTNNPQLQELIEYLRGTILPTDVQTGEVTTDQSGVEAPNIGSDLSPFNAIYAKRVVIGGVVVVITDLANFSPFIITREASAPATGQHVQTFHWPFETLTGAIVHLVGPQSGGDGGQGGFYCRPDFLSAYHFVTRTHGGWISTGTAFGSDGVLSDNVDVARACVRAGRSGFAQTSSFAIEGLSLGATISLGFGKGGAGGAGGMGSLYPQTIRTGSDFSVYDGNQGQEAGHPGTDAVGATWMEYGGRFEFVNFNNAKTGDIFPREAYGDLTLPGDASAFSGGSPYISFPGGVAPFISTQDGAIQSDASIRALREFTAIVGGSNYGIGGVAGIPAEGNTGAPFRAGAGGAGNAGHDGFALIHPKL